VIATLCHVRVRFGWLLRLFIVGCGLAACTTTASGAHDPTSSAPSSTVQPSTSATATPSPTGPKTTGAGVRPGEKPPALGRFERAHTSAGAVAFASFYIKALDWSYATSDPYLLKIVSAPTCVTCKKIIDGLTTLRAEGGHIQGDRLHLKSALLQSFIGKIKADYIVKVVATQEPGAIVRPTATTGRNQASTVTSYIYLAWLGSWKVLGDFGP
jgi:hypothetical protein